MSEQTAPTPVPSGPLVVVTGANGLVGGRTCAALLARGARVRAVVRRPGTAPDGCEERVGDFGEEAFAATAVEGADAAVTTVHPMGDPLEVQRSVGVHGTAVFARAARDAGVGRLVHVSTAAVYDRSPGVGDVDERSALVRDDAGDYPVTKREVEEALADLDGMTRVLLRPPAVLGSGASSVWNTLRPQAVRDDPGARRADPGRSLAWVHVDDLAALAADVAAGTIATAADPDRGPVEGGCTPVSVAAPPATWRDYLGAVCDAVGVEPEWVEEPVWRGSVLADRARAWGWRPVVSLDDALEELRRGLRD